MIYKYTDYLSEQEIEGITKYVKFFLFQTSEDNMMVELYRKKENEDPDFYPNLLQTYFDVTYLFRRSLQAVRERTSFKFTSSVQVEAEESARIDSVACQELRIHMLDKIMSVEPINAYLLGNDVTEGEFIQARKILGSYKLKYVQTR